MRSIPRNIDRKGEHLSKCDVCGVMWLRSALSRGRDGLLRCENDRPGRDALTLALLTAQRAAALAQQVGQGLPADGAAPDTLPVRLPEDTFLPTDISAVGGWLSVAGATSDVNGVSSVPDLMVTNPAVQTVDARKPVIEAGPNGLPCLRFATNDVLRWPIINAQNHGGNYSGWGMWMKQDVTSATMRLMRVSTGTNGASGFGLNLSTVSTAALACNYSSDGNSGNFSQVLTANNRIDTGWHFVTVEWSRDGTSTATRITLSIDATVITGTASGVATNSTLFAATGNLLIGNSNDGVASGPFNGLLGPDIYAFNSKMTDATSGLLTPDARFALMMYNNPLVVTPVPVPARLPENGPYTGTARRRTVEEVYNNEVPTYADPFTAVNKPGF